jgi:hypothetical protein
MIFNFRGGNSRAPLYLPRCHNRCATDLRELPAVAPQARLIYIGQRCRMPLRPGPQREKR